jgi:hypothetical protein
VVAAPRRGHPDARPVLTAAADFTAKAQAEDAGDLLLDPLFEIAVELVRHATGYRPDQPNPGFDGRFVLLEAINPTLWQRLSGG